MIPSTSIYEILNMTVMKKYLFDFFLLLTICLSPHKVTANSFLNINDFKVRYLNTRDGLSDRWTTSFAQDERGLIWVSTRLGIDCYNGRHIKNYNLPVNDTYIHGKQFFYLANSNHIGLIAYSNQGKFFRYNIMLDKFELIMDLKNTKYKSWDIRSLYIDSEDNFFICCNNGLLYKSNREKVIRCILQGREISSICEEKERHIYYISSSDGVFEYTGKNRIQKIVNDVNSRCVFFDDLSHTLWIGTINNGIMIWNTNSRKLINKKGLANLPKVPCRVIMRYGNNLLAGFDGGGIFAINTDANSFKLFTNADANRNGKLKSNGIYAIMTDRSNNLWIGSYSGGLTYMYPSSYKISWIIHEKANYQSLIDNHVNTIYEDKNNNIWFGTDNGLSVILKNGKWKHFLVGNVILAICDDPDGYVWAGGYGMGAYCIDPKKGPVKHLFSAPKGPLTTDFVRTLKCDGEGGIWIAGLYGKLLRYYPKSGKALYYNINQVKEINIIKPGCISVASSSGLYILDYSLGFKAPGTSCNLRKIANVDISGMYFSRPNVLWYGTDGMGVYCYNITKRKSLNFSMKNGLASNYIYSVQIDRNNRIWLTTNKGFSMILPLRNHKYKIVNLGYGEINEAEMLPVSSIQTHDGNFIYGTTEGAVLFNPLKYDFSEYKAPMIFMSINLNGKYDAKVLMNINKQLLNDKKIVLSYNQNSFELQFIAINYRNQNDLEYYYTMDSGNAAQWHHTEDASIRFINLHPGNYVLRIKSISRKSQKIISQKTIQIIISQPLWNTWYAWAFYFVVVFIMLYFFWNYYLNRIRQVQTKEKINFFINTSHDMRTPLTLIMAPLEDLNQKGNLSGQNYRYLQIARRNTNSLYEIISNLLDFEKAEMCKSQLCVEQADIRIIIENVIDSFKQQCIDKEIDIVKDFPDFPVTLWIDVEKIYRVFENLISNATKYTMSGGSIIIKIISREKEVSISVSDTGIGIPHRAQSKIFTAFYRAENAVNTNTQGSGIGLLFSQRVIKLHKGKLLFKSKEGVGTTFTILLPRGNKYMIKYRKDEKEESRHVQYYNKESKSPEVVMTEKSSSSIRMLIIEDNNDLCQYIGDMFADDYKVTLMENANKAWKYLLTNSVDIIISDVMMPGLQGDDFCRIVKSDMNTSHIPVILLTAKTDRQSIIDGLEYGADDYISKPFEPTILKIRVKNVLLNRDKLRNYVQKELICEKKFGQSIYSNNDLSALDKNFIEKCHNYVSEHMKEPNFKIVDLCMELAMSRTILYEKLKSLTGETPHSFILLLRMKRAAELLRQQIPIQETALDVGFIDSKYFSTVFKKYYGIQPSKYCEQSN